MTSSTDRQTVDSGESMTGPREALPRRTVRARRWLSRLLVLSVALAALATHPGPTSPSADASGSPTDLGIADLGITGVGQLAWTWSLETACRWCLFLPIGFFLGALLSQMWPQNRRWRWVSIGLATLLTLGITAALSRSAADGSEPLPNIVRVVFVCVTAAWTAWLGVRWTVSSGGLRWWLSQMVGSAAVGLGAGILLLGGMLVADPMVLPTEQLTTSDRRRLVEQLQQHDPTERRSDDPGPLALSQHDASQLIRWALSYLPGDQRMGVRFRKGQLALGIEYQPEWTGDIGRHFDAFIEGRLTTDWEAIRFQPTQIRVGRLTLPATLLSWCSPLKIPAHRLPPEAQLVLQSVQSIDMRSGWIAIRYNAATVKQYFEEDNEIVPVHRLTGSERAIREQLNGLVELAQTFPETLTLEQCIEQAFRTARARRGDVIAENRAAILALGYLLGHRALGSALGSAWIEPDAETRRAFWRVTLYGRRDWKKHFLLSAGLRVMLNQSASQDIGLLKEELDALEESGFSFTDLMMDRAGVVFGERLTQSAVSARRLQRLLAEGIAIEDMVPDPSHLPEGLSDEAFHQKFGGVGGTGFERLIGEMDQEIAGVPIYRGVSK